LICIKATGSEFAQKHAIAARFRTERRLMTSVSTKSLIASVVLVIASGVLIACSIILMAPPKF
jgi:hypothetical protein